MGSRANLNTAIATSLLRGIEPIAAAALLLLLSPLFLVLAATILVESQGSPIFAQTRVGRDLKPFKMYKFRTMRPGSEELHEEMMRSQEKETGNFLLNTDQDERRTRLGTALRRSGIDEIPQLINVVAGTMSLVGPRPMLPVELPFLKAKYLDRFSCSPGITGLAQIGCRPSTDLDRHLTLDLYYARHPSLRLYWKILFATPLVAWRGL